MNSAKSPKYHISMMNIIIKYDCYTHKSHPLFNNCFDVWISRLETQPSASTSSIEVEEPNEFASLKSLKVPNERCLSRF
jgi:hypothetical protein